MEEINLIILVAAGLALASVFTSVVAFRAGAPLLLLFLLIGLIAGKDGPGGIALADPEGAFLLASAALAVILFDSGFHTRLKSYRLAAAPAITLATVGVLVTAVLIALPARMLLGFSWPNALLLATSLSSTDAAALFFLLRVGGITIRDRVRSTLEIESGTNDPVAACLALTLLPMATLSGDPDWATLAGQLALQMGGGVLFGLLGGAVIVIAANRIKLEPGLYPIMVIGLAVALYALVNLVGGSGLLAAYLAGLVAGNARLPAAAALRRFQDGITWLAQIGMFVTLGLLARPSHFPALALPSLGLAVVVIVIARPVAVFLCLAPFHFTLRERLFVAWVGLRGAVSILLALVPVLGGVVGGETLFEIAFLVVMTSLTLQGWTVRPLARWLGLIVPEKASLVDRQEVDLPGLPDQALVTYRVHPTSPVAQGRPLPRWARPLLAKRGTRLYQAPRQVEAGDKVYLLAEPQRIGLLDKLFGRMNDQTATEASLYGDFTVGPDVAVKALCETYGLPLTAAEETLSLRELIRRELRTDLEIGDRLRVGNIDLIVREMEDGQIMSIGIALDPQGKPQDGWERLRSRLAGAFGI